MAQQTAAVDWIIQQLPRNYRNNSDWYKIFKQAKQMFQQQIADANIAGMKFIPVDPSRYEEDAKQYYTETYEKSE
jgi:hypothetical protein